MASHTYADETHPGVQSPSAITVIITDVEGARLTLPAAPLRALAHLL
jgi:hypothetical protein